MSRSFQKIIAWGRAKASKSHRVGHYDKIENKHSRNHNGKYIGRKHHWISNLQTVEDYKNEIRSILYNPAN